MPSSHDTRDVSSPRRFTVTIRAVRALAGYLSAHGHDPAALLRNETLDPALLNEPDARVPSAVYVRLWQETERLTDDPHIGLHVAEFIRTGHFGAIEYVVRSSETLAAGVTRLFRYYRVLHNAAEVGMETQSDRVILSHRLPLPGGTPRSILEFAMLCWYRVFRDASGMDWTPLEVRFPHPAPDDTSEHHRLFRTSVSFGHTRSELIVPRTLLDLPFVRADPALESLVEVQVVAMLKGLSNTDGAAVSDRLRHLLTDELCDGEPTLARMAKRLHMSARTLHRRLGEEGTTFRQVVTDVRRTLAERYLRERQLAVGEIAFLLGFSEASAFHRAFKRWMGEAPLAYRQRVAATHLPDVTGAAG